MELGNRLERSALGRSLLCTRRSAEETVIAGEIRLRDIRKKTSVRVVFVGQTIVRWSHAVLKCLRVKNNIRRFSRVMDQF
jgi:hypothetical protein